jgi:hypothetical protein
MANSITVDGGGALVTSDGSTTNGIIRVDYACSGCSGIKIQNFQLYNAASYCTVNLGSTKTPPLLNITRADINAWPSSPFTYTGPYAVDIYNNVFNCGQGGSQQPAAGILAWAALGGTSNRVNDLYIHGNYFQWSTVGIGGGNTAGPYGTNGCEVTSGFNDATSIYDPRNIIITSNHWYNAGQGSL